MKTISLYLFAALILAFLAGEIGRGIRTWQQSPIGYKRSN